MRSRSCLLFAALAWLSTAWAGPPDLDAGLAAYRRGDGRAALATLQPLAARGDAEAQYYLGRLHYYDDTGVRQSYRAAFRWFERAAHQGHAAAQYKTGGMYFAGRGVAQDDRLAVLWWRLAAAQGQAESLNNLGALFAAGRGVPRNRVLAYALQTLARDRGDEDAAENLRTKETTMSAADLEAAKTLAEKLREPGRLAGILAAQAPAQPR